MTVGGDEADRRNRQRRAGQAERGSRAERMVGAASRSAVRGVFRGGVATAWMADGGGDGDGGCGMRTADDDRTALDSVIGRCTRWITRSEYLLVSVPDGSVCLHLIVCLIGPGQSLYPPHVGRMG